MRAPLVEQEAIPSGTPESINTQFLRMLIHILLSEKNHPGESISFESSAFEARSAFEVLDKLF